VIPYFLGRIATFHNTEYHRDIGTPESLRRAEAEYPQI
jgi:mannose-1-phosphate guanylyltransferase